MYQSQLPYMVKPVVDLLLNLAPHTESGQVAICTCSKIVLLPSVAAQCLC